jgi:hypothetical protein
LRRIGYDGPISVEWEDAGMERRVGARQAREFLHGLSWQLPTESFDSAFSSDNQD